RRHIFKSAVKTVTCTHLCYFSLASGRIMSHNYTDISANTRNFPGGPDGNAFTSEHAPSAGLKRAGGHPPAPSGGDRSPLSRQRVVRSGRPGAGQVRDAAQRREGWACGGGSGRSLRPVPPGLLCHARVVQARGSAGAAAAHPSFSTLRSISYLTCTRSFGSK